MLSNKRRPIQITALCLTLAFTPSLFVGCKQDNPTVTPLKINGVDVENYTIVCDKNANDYNVRAAEYIASAIYNACGQQLEIKDDGEAQTAHEIVVGETSRDISAQLNAECQGVQFALSVNENHIAMEGDYFVIAAAAYYFVDSYITASSSDVTIPLGVSVHQPITKDAKNFIMLIGDGMGVAQTNLYDVFDAPAQGDKAYSDGEDFFYGYLLPYHGYSRTDSLDGTTDSAAGGTALSSGYKTHNGYVGRDGDGNDVTLITELAGTLGKATAVMSTERQTGATPSSFSAHAPDRSDASKILNSQSLLMQKYGTQITCNYDYYSVQYMQSSIEKRVTDTLAKLQKDEDGFFMMYEEAHIDKHSHSNDAEMTFFALMRFNQVIARFMEFAFYNPDTCVLITADHETGGLSITDNGAVYSTDGHTNANVPVFAWGKQMNVFNDATVENTQIPKTLAKLMGNNNFGANDEYQSLI